MSIIVDETRAITAKICAENRYATSFSVVLIQPINDATRTINPGNILKKQKIRDFFESLRRFRTIVKRARAPIKGKVKTGHPPIPLLSPHTKTARF